MPAGEYVPTHYDPYEPDPDKRYKKVVRRESDPAATTGRHVMGRQGRNDVSRLVGQAVRLRFYMKNAKLYSFQFR